MCYPEGGAIVLLVNIEQPIQVVAGNRRRQIIVELMKGALSRFWALVRRTSIVVSLAVMVALAVGAASTALAKPPPSGSGLLLGVQNTANAVTTLINSATGPALSLQVGQGNAPIAVNSDTKVEKLNVDQVDGQSFTCPTDTLFHEGVCIEKSDRGFSYFRDAEADCSDEDGRLPSVQELQTFPYPSENPPVNYEWTSQMDHARDPLGFSYDHAVAFYGVGPDNRRSLQDPESANQALYRCVVPPS